MRKIVKVFDASEATETSDAINILNAKRVTLIAKREGHSQGSSTITASVGIGEETIAYNKWISNITNTNVQNPTRVANLVMDSNSTAFITMSPEDVFEFIRITNTHSTDGTCTVWLVIDSADDIK